MNTSLSGDPKAASHLLLLHQVPISSFNYASFYKLRGEPANKDPYYVDGMRLRLPELQAEEQEAKKVKARSRSPYQVGEMRLQLQRAAGGKLVV